jgi:hypothetical protein
LTNLATESFYDRSENFDFYILAELEQLSFTSYIAYNIIALNACVRTLIRKGIIYAQIC